MNFRKIVLLATLFLSHSFLTIAQETRNLGPYTMFEQIIYTQKQHNILSFIANDCTRGRATGSMACEMVGQYIRKNFEKFGLSPYNGFYYDQFLADSSTVGRNVVGIVPSIVPSDEYVIVSAHYDHIGALNGFVYNGADDNASGVTALLNLAEIFGTMHKAKMGPNKNIIFVAFDGKELSMAGSRSFVKKLSIPKKNITCAINIDQIGSILEPVHKSDTNYVVVLGEQSLRKEDRGKLGICNSFYNLNLDIDYTFYGSKVFTELYYKLSDQVAFIEAGIPSILLTSGFHKHTYKITDDENIICYPVLKKRTLLVFYLIMML